MSCSLLNELHMLLWRRCSGDDMLGQADSVTLDVNTDMNLAFSD